jgi:hypothetical protein
MPTVADGDSLSTTCRTCAGRADPRGLAQRDVGRGVCCSAPGTGTAWPQRFRPWRRLGSEGWSGSVCRWGGKYAVLDDGERDRGMPARRLLDGWRRSQPPVRRRRRSRSGGAVIADGDFCCGAARWSGGANDSVLAQGYRAVRDRWAAPGRGSRSRWQPHHDYGRPGIWRGRRCER